jgi:hypothetical protein
MCGRPRLGTASMCAPCGAGWGAVTGRGRPVRERYRLSETDREAYAFFHGNVAAVE